LHDPNQNFLLVCKTILVRRQAYTLGIGNTIMVKWLRR